MNNEEKYIEGVDIPYSQEYLAGVNEIRKKMYPNGYLVEETKAIEEMPNQYSTNIQPPLLGTFNANGTYNPPAQNRTLFIHSVNQYVQATKHRGYKEIDSRRVYFVESNDHLNFFHPHFIRVFNEFLKAYQYDELIIVKGMSPPTAELPNPHTIGMGIDIYVHNEEQRNHIMNIAWTIGIPNIKQVGNFPEDVHIHLDICPQTKAMYDGIYYEGPWSLSRFT